MKTSFMRYAVLQLYDVDAVPPDDLGYSPESIMDVLKHPRFLQTLSTVRSHSRLGEDVVMSTIQLKDIVAQTLNNELFPGSSTNMLLFPYLPF